MDKEIEELIKKFREAYYDCNGSECVKVIYAKYIMGTPTIFLDNVPMSAGKFSIIIEEMNNRLRMINDILERYLAAYENYFGYKSCQHKIGKGEYLGQIYLSDKTYTVSEILAKAEEMEEISKKCLKFKCLQSKQNEKSVDFVITEMAADCMFHDKLVATTGLLKFTNLSPYNPILSIEDEERLVCFLINRRAKRNHESELG